MNTEKTTDELLDMLPSFLNINGELYHFKAIKGDKILIWFEHDDGNYLGQTYRSSRTWRDCASQMVNWLYEHKKVQYMPFGYKEAYESVFNTKIEHSRGF